MGQITFDEKKNSIIITNTLEHFETVDEVALNYMNALQFRGIFPLTLKQNGKKKVLECSVQGCITLKDYLGVGVTKKKFLSTLKWLVGLINEWENSYLNIGNLHLQLERIFIEPESKSLYCIYWPVFNCTNEQPVYLFFQSLPYYIDFNLHEDHSYLEEYKEFFYKGTATFVKDFYKMLSDLLKEENIPSGLFSTQLSTQTTRRTELPQQILEEKPQEMIPQNVMPWKGGVCPVCGADNKAGTQFCQDCGADLGKLQLQEIKPVQSGEELQIPDIVGEWNGETAVLQQVMPSGTSTPHAYLYHKKSSSKKWITKDVFVLGKDSKSCDFIIDSRVVSRKHAQIICRDGKFYIKDLNSTNYTYVDGSRILPNREIEIFNHTKLRLADEEFEFFI